MAMDMRRELAWCFVMAKWGCVSKSSDLQRYGYEMISKVAQRQSSEKSSLELLMMSKVLLT